MWRRAGLPVLGHWWRRRPNLPRRAPRAWISCALLLFLLIQRAGSSFTTTLRTVKQSLTRRALGLRPGPARSGHRLSRACDSGRYRLTLPCRSLLASTDRANQSRCRPAVGNELQPSNRRAFPLLEAQLAAHLEAATTQNRP